MDQVNERLRTAMLKAVVTPDDLAAYCGVDVKTIGRWISPGRMPHRGHRWSAARRLGTDESWLWPDAEPLRNDAHRAEIVRLYHDRASVPRDTWMRLMTEAAENIDVLVFSGTFFSQAQPRVAAMLTAAAARGVQVRLCFGDPSSNAVAIRDGEEQISGTLGAKIRASLTYYRRLTTVAGCEVRLHATTLYASLFRYDDEIMVNNHAWGEPASANPVLHLRRLDGGQVAAHWISSFDRVWDTAKPWNGEDL
jgi:hypothetical protein